MNKTVKLIFGVLITVFLGAIGSGVWEYILNPFLSHGSKLVLELSTLGVESFKDGMYQEVAKGFHEKSSVSLLSRFYELFSYCLLILALYVVSSGKKSVEKKWNLIERIRSMDNPENKEDLDAETLENRAMQINAEKVLKQAYFLLCFSVFLLIMQYVMSISESYINNAITHYYQSKRIILPYISEFESATLDSKFSSINSSKDYKSVIGEIENIAEREEISLPRFELW